MFDSAAPRWLGWPLVLLGALVAIAGLRYAGRRSIRSAYRPDPWARPEWLTAAAGVLVAAVFALSATGPLQVMVTPLAWPSAPLLPLAAILLAAGPAVWTPRLPESGGRP